MSGSTTHTDIGRRAKHLGLYMVTHSDPGGSGTRYKFSATDSDYYALPRASVLGIREATAWLDGYAVAMESIARGQSQQGGEA